MSDLINRLHKSKSDYVPDIELIDEAIARIAELEAKGLKSHAKLTKQLDYTGRLREENKRLDAALCEIKEYFGRDFDRYYGLVEIYRKARARK